MAHQFVAAGQYNNQNQSNGGGFNQGLLYVLMGGKGTGKSNVVSNRLPPLKFFPNQMVDIRPSPHKDHYEMYLDPTCEVVCIATHYVGPTKGLQQERILPVWISCSDDYESDQRFCRSLQKIRSANLKPAHRSRLEKVLQDEMMSLTGGNYVTFDDWIPKRPEYRKSRREQRQVSPIRLDRSFDRHDDEQLCACGEPRAVCGACGKGYAQRGQFDVPMNDSSSSARRTAVPGEGVHGENRGLFPFGRASAESGGVHVCENEPVRVGKSPAGSVRATSVPTAPALSIPIRGDTRKTESLEASGNPAAKSMPRRE